MIQPSAQDAPLWNITYTYDRPSPAGPYKGHATVRNPYDVGDTFHALFGRATITACRTARLVTERREHR